MTKATNAERTGYIVRYDAGDWLSVGGRTPLVSCAHEYPTMLAATTAAGLIGDSCYKAGTYSRKYFRSLLTRERGQEAKKARRRKDRLRVLFRVGRADKTNEVTAVLPDVEANPGNYTCYVHVGQHAECNRAWYNATRPARPAEYADLLQELTRIYHDCTLVVRRRLARRE